MTEFKIINNYIKRANTDSSVALGIGDDSAVMDVPAGQQIVQTMDTMVLGVHFDAEFSADALAHKLLHVNLSDIAAMGATPKWATVALTMPKSDEQWINDFATGLQSRSELLGVNLVGGDTTSGPLSVSMNLTGVVDKGQFLTRSGAKEGDNIYVSGYLGDAALALTKEGKNKPELIKRLRYPRARLDLGKQLLGVATACIDLSDGLLGDLAHICEQSKLKAQLAVEKLPLSTAYKFYFAEQSLNISPDYALNGGDDYELCFTANLSAHQTIKKIADQLNHPITKIGTMHKLNPIDLTADAKEKVICTNHSKRYQCKLNSWQHFAS